jgi:WD40 repeat protein/DNA-binding SARP family transcriptional activator
MTVRMPAPSSAAHVSPVRNAWRPLSEAFQRSFSARADPAAMNAHPPAEQRIHIPRGKGYGRPVEFRVLGSIEVVEEGNGSISLGGPKQRAVLAHLLLRANHLVPTDVLIDEVWGEEPPETARNALQSYASHLRKALGPERLEGSRAGYRLRAEPSELDAVRFQSLLRDARRLLPIDARAAVGAFDHALALWRGPAFADLAAEPSLRAEAARLDELRLGALEDRIEAQLTIGQQAEVVGELETLTVRYPLRERFWKQLMLALYRSGRQAEALTAFQRARELLADELGIDPSPELRRLHERILAQSPELDPGGEPLRGYRLLERLGEDPLGAVYRATQPNVGREVAIRVVHEHRANDPAFVRRFDAEAQAVATLEHPHVAPVHDYWREPGRAYVVTRFLRGGSLRGLLDRSAPIQPERAARILEQVASALAAAHRRGVGHGDLRPSNVMFDEEGNAYLTDFSIGRGTVGTMDDLEAFAALTREMLDQRVPMAVGHALHRADAVETPDQASRLLSDIVSAFGSDKAAPATAGVETRNPYKGLRPFLEADAGDFFGREAFIERLLDRLSSHDARARFVAVVGPSGSGKSSVVSAGLVAAIRRGAIPGSERWFVTDMHPGHHPFEELDTALMRVAVSPPAGLLARLESGPRGLLDVADAIVPEDAELLLVVDQFEEAFTLTESEDDRALLLESLRVATADPSSRVRVIATLRADFYDRPLRYPRMGPLLGSTTEVLTPLTPEELEGAIVRPAERSGLSVDRALVPQIAADVAEQPGALPLVQYALTELYDRRLDGRLTLEGYREIGGVGGALAASAEHLYATRKANGREAVRQLFLRLVTLGEGSLDTRRRVLMSELSAVEVDASAMESVIDAYGRHRLLTFDRDPATREPTVEVAHEALLGAWERLSAWIDEAREDVRMHRRLSEAAREWESSGREPSFLLTGSRLDQFEGWAAGTSLALGLQERAYLTASVTRREEERTEQTARRNRERLLERRSVKRLRALVAVFAVAALVAAALTVITNRESDRAERESRVAIARELAAAAVANLDDDAERAILLAIEAVRTTRSADGTVLPEAEEALHRAVVASRIVLSVSGVGGSLDWSQKGVFVTEGPENTGVIDIRDATTGERVLSFDGHDIDVNDVAFSPDGSMLATTGDGGALKLWDPATGNNLWTSGGTGEVWGPSFSADGSLVAAAWGDKGRTRVLDTSDGRVLRTFTRAAGDTAFSPDGRMLAVAPRWNEWGDVLVFDLRTGKIAFSLKGGFAGRVAWSPDGLRLATNNGNGSAQVWDGKTGKLLFSLFGHHAAVFSVDWSPDGSRLVTASDDGTARVWEVTKTEGFEQISLSAQDTAGGVYTAVFSPDGRQVMTSDADITATKIWDVGIGGDAEWLNLPAQYGDNAYWAGDVEFLPDGRRLVSTNDTGMIAIWDLKSGGELRAIPVDGSAISSFDVTPDGSVLAAGLDNGFATAWDLTTGGELFSVQHHDMVVDVAWSPDGEHLVTATPGSIMVLDATGGLVRRLNEKGDAEVLSARFSPDGRLVVTAVYRPQGPRQTIWDWERGTVVGAIDPGDATNAAIVAVFDPTGSKIATSGAGGAPRIWDIETGKSVVLSTHRGQAWDIVFSPDGSRVATADSDGTVRLFDAASGEQVLAVRGHERIVAAVAFSPDGTMLASKSLDGTVRVWALDLDDLLDIARQQVTRSLTDEECRQYLHLEACD